MAEHNLRMMSSVRAQSLLAAIAVAGGLVLSACLRAGFEPDPAKGADGGGHGDAAAPRDGRVAEDAGDPEDAGADRPKNDAGGIDVGGWKFRKSLTIRPSTGAPLTDFPVLVSLRADADLRAAGLRAGGDDLAFVDGAGTHLAHELEAFDASMGSLVAWVRVPALSDEAETSIYMYYGNDAEDLGVQQASTQVWDDSFVAVHHLVGLRDSTRNGHDATLIGQPLAAVAKIGSGAALDGDDGYTLGDVDALDGVARMTISAWLRMDVLTDIQSVAGKFGADSTEGWGLASGRSGMGLEGADDVAFAVGPLGASGTGDVTSSNALSVGSFRHWVAVFDGTAPDVDDKLRIYIDGVEIPSTPYGSASALPNTTPQSSEPVHVGTSPKVGSNSVTGVLDEVRFSSTARSRAWIATEYRNQNDPASFVTVGAQQAL